MFHCRWAMPPQDFCRALCVKLPHKLPRFQQKEGIGAGTNGLGVFWPDGMYVDAARPSWNDLCYFGAWFEDAELARTDSKNSTSGHCCHIVSTFGGTHPNRLGGRFDCSNGSLLSLVLAEWRQPKWKWLSSCAFPLTYHPINSVPNPPAPDNDPRSFAHPHFAR
jgi:hypothetical protein